MILEHPLLFGQAHHFYEPFPVVEDYEQVPTA